MIDSGNCIIKNNENIYDVPQDYRDVPPAAVDLWPVRIFERSDRREINQRLQGKEISVKLELLGGKELARFYKHGTEIEIGVDIKRDTNQLMIEKEPLKVLISSLDCPGKLWLLPTNNLKHLELITKKLCDTLSSNCLRHALNVTKGHFVAVKCRTEVELFRGQILDVADGSQIKVHLIDVGNDEVVDMHHVYELPESVSVTFYPALAYFVEEGHCHLSNSEVQREQIRKLIYKINSVTDPQNNSFVQKMTAQVSLSLTVSLNDHNELEFYYDNDTCGIGYSASNAAYGMRCQAEAGIMSSSMHLVECLREEQVAPDLSLNLSLVNGIERKTGDNSLLYEAANITDQIIVTSPTLKTFPKSTARDFEKSKYFWSVGDRVVAYLSSVSSWKAGVIHEIDSSSALIVCEDHRPEHVDISLIKPSTMPVEALNMFETDVGTKLGHKPDTSKTVTKENEAEISSSHPQAKSVTATASKAASTSCGDSITHAELTMTPSMVFSSDPEEFCQLARSGKGSRFLQSLISASNTRLCQNMLSLLLSSSSTLRMMTNAKSCFIFKKLLMNLYILKPEQQEALIQQVDVNFGRLSTDQFGYHVAMTAVTHLGQEWSNKFVQKIENKSLLLGMIKSPFGTFVAQACVPLFPPSTVNFVVNSLVGHVVTLSNTDHSCYFLQTFLQHWGHSTSVNFIIDDFTKHLQGFVRNPKGIYTFETLVNVRKDIETLSKIVDWFLVSIEAVYKNKAEVKALKIVVKRLVELSSQASDNSYSELFDKIVFRLIVGNNAQNRSHIVAASCSDTGAELISYIINKSSSLSSTVRINFVQSIQAYRTVLKSDSIGCKILKKVQVIA